MNHLNRVAPRSHLPLLALALAGLLWGCSAPLTKVALGALAPAWLTAVRFVLAAAPLLWCARRGVRAAVTPRVVAGGLTGYGVVVALWNEGLARTSVSHGALMVGAVPAMVALVAVAVGRGSVGARAWLGFGIALAGVGLVAAGGGGTASLSGDLLVLGSTLLSAAFTVYQPDLLAGRDPLAVTAVQFAAAAVLAVPYAVVREGADPMPAASGGAAPWLAATALAVAGTLLPFTLFAWGQSRATPEVAGAFLNLEPVVGVAAGAIVFGDPFGALQVLGGLAVLVGIGLSAVPEHLAPATGAGGRGEAECGSARGLGGGLGAPELGGLVGVGDLDPARFRLLRHREGEGQDAVGVGGVDVLQVQALAESELADEHAAGALLGQPFDVVRAG
ncbi:MAG TPA: DMT family transporter [Kineosporiaceae bacterium]